MAVHPGEILLRDFLEPDGLSAEAFAAAAGLSPRRIEAVLAGRRPVDPHLACLLAEALGTTPEFWLNLQAAHDLVVSAEGTPRTRIA